MICTSRLAEAAIQELYHNNQCGRERITDLLLVKKSSFEVRDVRKDINVILPADYGCATIVTEILQLNNGVFKTTDRLTSEPY